MPRYPIYIVEWNRRGQRGGPYEAHHESLRVALSRLDVLKWNFDVVSLKLHKYQIEEGTGALLKTTEVVRCIGA